MRDGNSTDNIRVSYKLVRVYVVMRRDVVLVHHTKLKNTVIYDFVGCLASSESISLPLVFHPLLHFFFSIYVVMHTTTTTITEIFIVRMTDFKC